MLNINGTLRESDVDPCLTGRKRARERAEIVPPITLITTGEIKYYFEVMRVAVIVWYTTNVLLKTE